MKLSTRGRDGVRLMLELALHYGEGPILLKEISPEHDAGSDGGKTEAPGGGEA